MEHPEVKTTALACFMAAALMFGGCAFYDQRAFTKQASAERTRPAAPTEITTPVVALPEPDLDGSQNVLLPPSTEPIGPTGPRNSESADDPESFARLTIEDPPSQTRRGDSDASGQSQSHGLPATGVESRREDDDPDSAVGSAIADSRSAADQPDRASPDLWHRIRNGFALPARQDSRISKEAKWFSRNPHYLDRVAEQAQPYLHYIVTQVETRDLPSEIVLVPVVESAFEPYAYSPGRAAGIWQFIPATGRRFGLELNWWYDGRRDIAASTRAALDYLEYLHDFFDGDWLLALAAYNAGEGTVLKAMRSNQTRRKPTDFWSLRLPRETQRYVPRLLALRNIVAAPEKMGLSLTPIRDEPYLTSVDLDSQLDLATAARLADMDLEELHQLNPGFNRWATAPDGPHRLLVPLDKAERFAARVSELPPENRMHWVRHRIRRGDTLGGLAVRYRTTVGVLRKFNNLHGNLVRAGHDLVIPVPARAGGGSLDTVRATVSHEAEAIHTVTRGDTLWDLARHYGTTVPALCRWNNMSPGALLQPGQRVVVKLKASSGTTTVGLHTITGPAASATSRKITYRVRRGDSLWGISQRFKVTIQELKHWNRMTRKQYLQPGQKLTLYVPPTADSDSS